jgi:hypothetical protein
MLLAPIRYFAGWLVSAHCMNRTSLIARIESDCEADERHASQSEQNVDPPSKCPERAVDARPDLLFS